MVKEIRYTSINRIMEDVMDNPMLTDVTLEQVVRYTLRFMSLHGYPEFFQDNEADVEIHDFRGMLPCDVVSIKQVRECKTGLCMRAMTGSFLPDKDFILDKFPNELAFKTQGRIIYTTFPEGMVHIAYKSIPVDDNGFPMILDNEVYLNALEAFIKVKIFGIKFDMGKLDPRVLQNAKIDYMAACNSLSTEFRTPSVSEAEAYSRMHLTLIRKMKEFDKGFRSVGNREYLRNH